MERRSLRHYSSLIVIAIAFAGCGKSNSSGSSGNSGNPGSPSGGGTTCSSVGVLGAARGTINATIDGTTFNGGIPTGNAVYTPLPSLGPGLAPSDVFVINAVCGDGSQIVIGSRAGTWQNGVFVLGRAGQTQIGVDAGGNALRDPQTQQPLTHSIQYTLVRSGAAAGGWIINLTGGTGSITLNSISSTSVSGSFTATLVASAGGATGTKQLSGAFNATF
jgi:hypothetical protein